METIVQFATAMDYNETTSSNNSQKMNDTIKWICCVRACVCLHFTFIPISLHIFKEFYANPSQAWIFIKVLSICGHQISCKCEVASASCHFFSSFCSNRLLGTFANRLCGNSLEWTNSPFERSSSILSAVPLRIGQLWEQRHVVYIWKINSVFSSSLVDVNYYVMHGLPWI